MTQPSVRVEDDPPTSFPAALPPLLFLTSIFLLNFTSRTIFSPLLPVIRDEMGLSHADSGSFFLCISSGYFVSILLSGYVSSWIGHKRSIVFSSVGSALMLFLIAQSTSLVGLRLGLICLGMAAGLYLPSGLVTISKLVPPAYAARGMAVHELAPNISFVITPLICAGALHFVSWRGGLIGFGVVLLMLGLLFQLFGYNRQGAGSVPRLDIFIKILKMPSFWLITLMFSMAICSTLGLYAMMPLYLVSGLGMDLESGNTLVSISRIGSVFMPLVGGWVGDRYGNRRVMGTVLGLAGLLTIPIGFTQGWLLVLLVVVQPMIAVCFFPSAFAVVGSLGPEGQKNVAVSLCIPLAFLGGGGILPTFIGAVGDFYSLGTGITTAGVMMALASLCCLGILGDKEGKVAGG